MRAMTALVTCWLGLAAVSFGIELVPMSQEIAIGRQAHADFLRTKRRIGDRQVRAYVDLIGKQLVVHAEGPKYPYSFHVADEAAINAFALPGGPIWINRGVLEASTSEAQVASVLAHEVAHISSRHTAEQLTRSATARLGIGLLSALLGNTMSAATTRAAAGLLTEGVFLRFTREDELHADRAGLDLLVRAGWDSRGMLAVLEMLRREEQGHPERVSEFLSTHPSSGDRLAHVHALITQRSLRPGRVDSPAFQAIRARLVRQRTPKDPA